MILDMLSQHSGVSMSVANCRCHGVPKLLPVLCKICANSAGRSAVTAPTIAWGQVLCPGGEPYRPRQQPPRTGMEQLAQRWPDSGIVLTILQDRGMVIWECGAYRNRRSRREFATRFWKGLTSRIGGEPLQQRMRWINQVGLLNAETWPGIANRQELLATTRIRRQGHAHHNPSERLSSVAVLVALNQAAELRPLGITSALVRISEMPVAPERPYLSRQQILSQNYHNNQRTVHHDLTLAFAKHFSCWKSQRRIFPI